MRVGASRRTSFIVDDVRLAARWLVEQARAAWEAGLAARLGDGFLADAPLTPHQAREVLDLYRERAAAHGRAPSALAIRRDIHVGADDTRVPG